ncbi:MAG TPA: hypothetical protein VGB89_00045 [Bacteroidota bacterium]
MKMTTLRIAITLLALFVPYTSLHTQQGISSTNQGYSMKIQMDNRGVFGLQAYPGGAQNPNGLGLEYPAGTTVEHLFGSGIWVGGLLDTTASGSGTRIRVVSTGYQGWEGPLFEFYPGSSPADTIWKTFGIGDPEPPGWSAYWGSLLPFRPLSDNDNHCLYSDNNVVVSGAVPMRLKVAQSSFSWNHPYADGILIVEYRIVNAGPWTIDSAYIGLFSEIDVGEIGESLYFMDDYSGYYPSLRTGFVASPLSFGSTPVGIRLLEAPRPWDSLRITFQWYPGIQSPFPDSVRYSLLSSGAIRPDEYPALSDTRFLLGCGPFQIRPSGDPNPDTLKFAVAFIAAENLVELRDAGVRALDIYQNGIPIAGIKSSRHSNEQGGLQ